MLTATFTANVATANVAKALGLAVSAAPSWFRSIKCQSGRGASVAAPWASEAVLSGPFTFVVVTAAADGVRGEKEHDARHTFCERKLAKALAILAASYPASYGRLMGGYPAKMDGEILLQLAAFGFERFERPAKR